MPRDRRPEHARIYVATERFVDEYLRTDGSLFTPGRPVASVSNLDDLHRRFNEQPDESSANFLEKFSRQLSSAADEVVQLAAELVYIHLVFADDIGGRSKRDTIGKVLSWMENPLPIPEELDVALDHGVASTGVAFKAYRPNQLWLLIDMLRSWKQLDDSNRSRLLEDPWAFKAFLFDIPLQAAYTQREALLHIVHPDTFESIVSRDHKSLIAEAFSDRVPEGEEDVDRALDAIRQSLAEEDADFAGFYDRGVMEVWRPDTDDDEPEPGTTLRAWLVRHKVAGDPRITTWLQDGYASIGWGELGNDAIGMSRDELVAAMERAFPDASQGRRRNHASTVDQFLRQMRTGDMIVTSDGDAIYVGVVTSAPRYVDGSEEAFRRTVEWANPEAPIARVDLSPSAYSKLRALRTVSNISEDAQEFADLAGLDLTDQRTPTPVAPGRVEVRLPDADQDLADDLMLPRDWLQEGLDLLARKRQVVFYGPPGTGKTFVAQRIGDHLTQHGGTYTLVQFHPSYAYEDFFEGFRPRDTGSGVGLSFELVPGPLRRIAEEAAEDPENPYVLIIDEINRANLAKVFGELYFLLEYREQSVSLQYSPDEFSLPKNLFVIGTMNTADRSIALVDAAMRRRFYFVGFFPQRHPIDKLLDRWLDRNGHSAEPAALLSEVNRRIGEEDFSIGPSYLMTSDVGTDSGLARIWKHAILPLLEEHYVGTSVDVETRFGLPALKAAIRRAEAEDTEPEEPS